jgi:sulfur carrier protein ThiS adenylyltransferase
MINFIKTSIFFQPTNLLIFVQNSIIMTFEMIRSKLANYTVGIAGAGGLGSNCAVALARSGIGRLILVDFDTVSESNLNRQYYFIEQIGIFKVEALKQNIQKINPNILVKTVNERLTEINTVEIFSDCDIIVEAFDRAEEKQMLIETLLSEKPFVPLVSGLGMAGFGNTSLLKVRQIDNLYICGDEVTEISDNNPPFGPRVGIVANMQANIVVELLLNRPE